MQIVSSVENKILKKNKKTIISMSSAELENYKGCQC